MKIISLPKAMRLMSWILATAGFLTTSEDAQSIDGLKAWTPQDSINVRYFNPPNVEISRDGSMFFFKSQRGSLACDCNIYELFIFSTSEVRRLLAQKIPPQHPPQPLYSLVRSSSGNRGAEFWGARWEPDGASIVFNGSDESGKRQMYRLNVNTRELTKLTDWPYGASFTPQIFGHTIIAPVPVPKEKDGRSVVRYPMYVLDKATIEDGIVSAENRPVTFAAYAGGKPWSPRGGYPELIVPSSSEGHSLIAITTVDVGDDPEGWCGYDRWRRVKAGLEPDRRLHRFLFIDAEKRNDRFVFDAPIGTATQIGYSAGQTVSPTVLWARDTRHAVLVNTALPVTEGDKVERSRMAYIASYDADSGKYEVIEPLEETDAVSGKLVRVTAAGWLKEGTELLIRHEVDGKPTSGNVYKFRGGKWQRQTVSAKAQLPTPTPPAQPPELTGGLKVSLRESMNDAPVMVASDGSHDLVLTEPDPALKGKKLVRQEPFTWTTPDGQSKTGGLLLPESTGSGPPPLIIQSYKYEPDKFKPDGLVTNGYAAQALVARGMAVLNVNIPALDTRVGTLRELTDFVAETESAADALAARKLIDRNRVGLIGFSRGGYETFYAITHPGKTPPAAAIIDDSFTGTYGSYLLTGAVLPSGHLPYSGGTFWENKAAWLEHEPTFNLDRVRTPALFTAHTKSSIPFLLDVVGAFTVSKRPLEFLVFPDGGHELVTPRQRLASLDSTVEWMAFWLQGKSPDDPQRAERWTLIREDWEKAKAKLQ